MPNETILDDARQCALYIWSTALPNTGANSIKPVALTADY
jgi:hypothetical protein